MLQSLAVLDDFAKHLYDFIVLTDKVRVVTLGHLHDVVPGEAQTAQPSILLQNFQQGTHLDWHQMVPADVEGDKRFLSSNYLAQVHQTEVIQASVYQGELSEVVPLPHAFEQGFSRTPNALGVDQMQFL